MRAKRKRNFCSNFPIESLNKAGVNIAGAISLFLNIAGAIAPVLNTPLSDIKCSHRNYFRKIQQF